MSAQVMITAILGTWLSHVGELLLIIGWWMMVGLALGALTGWLLPSLYQPRRRIGGIIVGTMAGILLPICNCGILPIALSLPSCGWSLSAILSFFAAATLLNPAAVLTAYALLGPQLTGLYVLLALLSAVLIALFAEWPKSICVPATPCKLRFSECMKNSFLRMGPELAFWYIVGIFLEGALLTVFPPQLFGSLLRMPEAADPLQMAAMGIARYMCIPDDIPFAASLSAAGAPPAGTLLFLLIGIVSNLPEVAALAGMLGRRVCSRMLILSGVAFGACAWMIHLLLAEQFVPLMDLSAADGYLRMAEMLSVRTWMSARYLCAAALVAMGILGACRRIKPVTNKHL